MNPFYKLECDQECNILKALLDDKNLSWIDKLYLVTFFYWTHIYISVEIWFDVAPRTNPKKVMSLKEIKLCAQHMRVRHSMFSTHHD
jgi:hypothetical protein